MDFDSNKAWGNWYPSALFILYQFILQVFPGVIIKDLEFTYHLNVVQISNMSSLFYYAFMLSLLPSGILIDRFNINKILTFSILFCAIGSLFFAWSSSILQLSFGRILMGIGASSSFIATMRIISLYFPKSSSSLASGLTVASAMIGAIIGQTIIPYITQATGWRNMSLIMAVLGLIIGILVIFKINKKTHILSYEDKTTFINDFLLILKNKKSWKLAMYAALVYIALPVFAGLWGILYFVNVYGFSHYFSLKLCSIIWLGMAFGSPIYGFLADKYSNREKLMTFGSIFLLISFFILLYSPILNKYFMLFIAFLVGFHCGIYSLAFSSMRSFIPKKVTGLSIAFMMIVVMIIVAIITQLIGLILFQLEFYNIDLLVKYRIATIIIPILLCMPPIISRSISQQNLGY